MRKLISGAALILALSLAGCGTSNDKEEPKQDKEETSSVEKTSANNDKIYQDYIKEVSPIMEEIYNFGVEWDELRQQSTDGTLNDQDLSNIIANELLPKNMQLVEQVESLDVDNELVDTHEKLIDMLNKQNSALSEIASAIDTNDLSKITGANEYLSEVRKIEREYVRELEKHIEQ